MFQCQRPSWFNPSTYITLQRRPSAYQIKYCWQRLLRQWCNSDGKIAASLNLGQFIQPGSNLRLRRSTYLIGTNNQQIFHWSDDKYWTYQFDNITKTYKPTQEPAQWTNETQITPVDIEEGEGGIRTLFHLHNKPLRPQLSPPTSPYFEDYLQTLP